MAWNKSEVKGNTKTKVTMARKFERVKRDYLLIYVIYQTK